MVEERIRQLEATVSRLAHQVDTKPPGAGGGSPPAVFTNGLADANLWTNRFSLTDVGLNWHLIQYLKVYLDWQHGDFGSPVQFAPGRRQETSDMFLLRAQLVF